MDGNKSKTIQDASLITTTITVVLVSTIVSTRCSAFNKLLKVYEYVSPKCSSKMPCYLQRDTLKENYFGGVFNHTILH